MNDSLVGKKEIAIYTRRSWITIQVWIEKENFPACKLDGVWESMKPLIDAWKVSKINGNGKSKKK